MTRRSRRTSRPAIVSNNPLTMGRVLNTNIPDLNSLDISTGYIDIGGFSVVADELERRSGDEMPVRLLVGSDLITGGPKTFEEYSAQYAGRNSEAGTFSESLRRTELGEEEYTRAARLLDFIRQPWVLVRKTRGRFNHSKCYIMNDVGVLIGSSNFTRNGLVENMELNAGVYGVNDVEEAERWFDEAWEEAEDAKDDLVRQIKESKFGEPTEPYLVYIKMIFEKYRDLLESSKSIKITDAELANFQKDAVRTGIHIIRKFGGSIIADATGLGKTNMGMEIIRQMISARKRVLLIAPAQVLKTVWSTNLREAGIPVWDMISSESVGLDSFAGTLTKYRKTGFVIVDESHNFRSKSAKRRTNLMKLLLTGGKKQVLLLTATPINNSLMDLYYQLLLITRGDETRFWDTVGIPHLANHMKRASKIENLQHGLDKIEQLLDHVMVRRTRTYIRKVFRNDKINGKPIEFPSHDYARIDYSLSQIYGNVFQRMLECIERMEMAPYAIESYDTSRDAAERRAAKRLAHLQTNLLFKRFESSREAMRVSIENKRMLYLYVIKHLKNGNILKIREFRKLMLKYKPSEISDDGDTDDNERRFKEELENIEAVPVPANFDAGQFREDLESDLENLNVMHEEIEKVRIDRKIKAVFKKIRDDGALETQSKKVLVFTEYTATAKYLRQEFEKEFGDRRILMISGNTKQEDRNRIIGEFAPRANRVDDAGDGGPEADILISTEVLSEGQNLQDCNYVVNYDLPWNPMKIVQRVGRVDRLASRFKVIRTRACFPDKDLDAVLKLAAKLHEKIDVVNETVGLESELLGEAPSSKEFNGWITEDIRKLASGGGSPGAVIEKLQEAADITYFSPLLEIQQYLEKTGYDITSRIPLGRRSGKAGAKKCAILAYKEVGRKHAVHFVEYDHGTGTARTSDEDDRELIAMAACKPGTATHLPGDDPSGSESFKELVGIDKIARQKVLEKITANRNLIREVRSGRNTPVESLKNDAMECVFQAGEAGLITDIEGDQLVRSLKPEYVNVWMPDLKEVITRFKSDGNAGDAVEKIQDIVKGFYTDEQDDDAEDDIDEEPALELVGAMFIEPAGPGNAAGSKTPRLDAHV